MTLRSVGDELIYKPKKNWSVVKQSLEQGFPTCGLGTLGSPREVDLTPGLRLDASKEEDKRGMIDRERSIAIVFMLFNYCISFSDSLYVDILRIYFVNAIVKLPVVILHSTY